MPTSSLAPTATDRPVPIDQSAGGTVVCVDFQMPYAPCLAHASRPVGEAFRRESALSQGGGTNFFGRVDWSC